MHTCSWRTIVCLLHLIPPPDCDAFETSSSLLLPRSATLSPQESSTEDVLFKFVTRPDIAVPKWDVRIHEDSPAISSGFWFIAPYERRIQTTYQLWNGPLIYDGRGELIWSGVSMFQRENVWDLRTTEIDGRQMISLLDHVNSTGFVLDDGYQVHTAISGIGEATKWDPDAEQKGFLTNGHDFNVIGNGSRALLLTRHYENSTLEESRAVGFEGNCAARWEGFREVDIASGDTMFEWNAHHHIGLEESTFKDHLAGELCNATLASGWDILHINSVDKFPDGDYLISVRHTDALYKISHTNGSIVWRLGGVRADFVVLNDDANFSRQHHARSISQNKTHAMISLFDNAVGQDGKYHHPTHNQSRGLVLLLHTGRNPMTVDVVQQLEHPEHLLVNARGSVQVLENNNTFVGWAHASRVTEHAADGRLLVDAKLKVNNADSYRAYKYHWVGKPLAPPDVHSAVIDVDKQQQTVVHVSWNGATEVKTWNIYKKDASTGAEQIAASAERQGFETSLTFDGEARYVVAEAVDSDSNVLSRSETFATLRSSPYTPNDWGIAYMYMLALLCIAAVVIIALWFGQRLQRGEMFGWQSEKEAYTYISIADSDLENQ